MKADTPTSSFSEVNDVSCARCRKRKIKCDRREPCSKCVEAATQCTFPSGGERRRPAPRRYVESLEARVNSLRAFIERLAIADDASRRALLANEGYKYLPTLSPPQLHNNSPASRPASYKEDPKSSSEHTHKQSPSGSPVLNDVVLARAREGCLKTQVTRKAAQFFGGTSLISMPLKALSSSPATRVEEDDLSILSVSISVDSGGLAGGVSPPLSHGMTHEPHSPTCRLLMATFFNYCYEYNHCIYREYFLRDYAAGQGPYYSDMLLYAVCAVGALVAHDTALAELSITFARHSERLVLESLETPDLTTLQTLLILGQLEIGHGHSSKGWLYCGMAFRLTHEMGLHLDPNNWSQGGSDNSRNASTADREVLRRVYWAAFVLDKQLSLYFGRPPALYPNEADVRDTIRIPYPPEWEELLDTYISKDTSVTAFEDGIALVGAFVHWVELAKIFHTMIVDVFENRRKTNNQAVTDTAHKVHLAMERWMSALPQNLHWSQWTVTCVPHYVLHLHMLFHTGMIILHRPPRKHLESTEIHQSEDVEICYGSLAAIIQLLRTFGRQHRYQSLPLSFVHTLSAAASVVLLKQYLEKLPWDNMSLSKPLGVILEAIEAVKIVWPCVREVKASIMEAMEPEYAHLPGHSSGNPGLPSVLDYGVQSLPNTWFLRENDSSHDLGFLIMDNFLNGD